MVQNTGDFNTVSRGQQKVSALGVYPLVSLGEAAGS